MTTATLVMPSTQPTNQRGRWTPDLTDVGNQIDALKKATGDDKIDSLLVAPGVNPWHGHGVHAVDQDGEHLPLTVEMIKKVFPRAGDLYHAPVVAIPHDFAAKFFGGFAPLASAYGSGNVEDFNASLQNIMQTAAMMFPFAVHETDDTTGKRSVSRMGLVSSECGVQRAVVRKARSKSPVPVLRTAGVQGIVGGQHVLYSSEEMIALAEALASTMGERIEFQTAGTLDGASTMFLSSAVRTSQNMPLQVDKCQEYLNLIQGTTGKIPLTITVNGVLMVCRNTVTHAFRDKRATKIRHTLNMHDKVGAHIKAMAEQAAASVESWGQILATLSERMLDTRLTTEQTEAALASYVFGADRALEYNKDKSKVTMDAQAKLDALTLAYFEGPGQVERGISDTEHNLWGVYNAVTFFESHIRPTVDPLKDTSADSRASQWLTQACDVYGIAPGN